VSWWFFRSKTEEAEADADAPPSPEVTPGRTVEDRLLNLQRSAGNKSVQRMVAKSASPAPDTSPPGPARSGGEPLPEGTRELMESRFGESFDGVRIHADEEAAASATELGANAFTTGRDVYFGRGKYAPDSPDGQRLLAHELTHVVQQEGGLGAAPLGNKLSEPGEFAEREAEAVADATERGERIPAVVSTGKGIQRDVGWAQRGPLADPYGTLLLLNAFAKKFPDAARLILQNLTAMKLVNEAEAAGVQFGGYAEDGPGKDTWPYTVGNTVYVPKARTVAVVAVSDFLFELNNALRAPKFAALMKGSEKGSKGTLSAKDYAYKTIELEVEGMLRLGEIWFDMKKTGPKSGEWNKYDADFFLAQYTAFKDGKKTKEDIIKHLLKSVYTVGKDAGKTHEQYYMDQYNEIRGGK
jgi:hypothetical protein